MRHIIVLIVLFMIQIPVVLLRAQTEVNSVESKSTIYYLQSRILDGDTLPHVMLNEVLVLEPWNFKNRQEYQKYHRMVRNIKVTLPYARLAGEKLAQINQDMSTINSKKERRQFLKEAENQLFAEFEAPLRKLTFSQGKLLIRLIDRETGDNSYNLIKEYKGGVPAFFWQGVARIFGANLKDEYNAHEDDKMIEHIIRLIDAGAL